MNLSKPISPSSKIAVLYGGFSSEREVSLRSGKAVAQALRKKYSHLVEIDVDSHIAQKLQKEEVEAAFIVLHGKYGEDGAIQGLLETLKIPYTGSGILSSALCMDKILTKRILQERAFLTASFYAVNAAQQDLKEAASQCPLNPPLIIKPSREGSTIGIQRVFEKSQLLPALEEASKFDSQILVEQYIQGTEVTAGILCGESLPLVEVRPKSGFYDFQSKYTKGSTEYLVPSSLSEGLSQKIQKITLEIYQELGCEGCARADFIVDKEGYPYFLEINTIPGMTETSLIPKAAAHLGISFEELVEKILNSARLKL